MRLALATVLGLFGLILMHAPAHAEKRVALVIGNGAYEHTTELTNPASDADLVAQKFKAMGYDVVLGKDLTNARFRTVLREFATKLQIASTGVFFYAGHGLQVNGRNYLVPVDADIKIAADLRWQTVEMQDILDEMQSKKRTSVVLLDACRDNPLSRKLARALKSRSASVGRGLARISAGSGTFVGFATAPGEVALDGTGKNSPFTTALAEHIATPGLDVSVMMRRVRSNVVKITNGDQVPWSNSSLLSAFEFHPQKALTKPPTFTSPSDNEPVSNPSHSDTRQKNTSEAWAATQSIGSCDAYSAFADEYQGTFYARLAGAWNKKNCGKKNALPPIQSNKVKINNTLTFEKKIKKYIKSKFLNDREIFDDNVFYYDKGIVDRATVLLDKEQYALTWPVRDYSLIEGSLKVNKQDSSRYSAIFDYRFRVSNATETKSGRGTTRVVLRDVNGRFVVVGVSEVTKEDRSKLDHMERGKLARSLQQELKRVGCYAGEIDGDWGSGSRAALKKFNQHARLSLDADMINQPAIDTVKKRSDRVCPQLCNARQEARGGRCIPKTCAKGKRLGSRGNCIQAQSQKRDRLKTRKLSAARAKSKVSKPKPAVGSSRQCGTKPNNVSAPWPDC